MKPIFFQTPTDFRAWLQKHHTRSAELWVGYFKKDSGKPGISWPESVDEALCFGWIDGIRKSIWSSVNIKRARALIAQGRMQPAGLKAYEARRQNRSGKYSYEQRSVDLVEPYNRLLRKNKGAWSFFQSQPASYRKAISWWIVSARQEATRLKRLDRLMALSAQGQRLPELMK